MSGYSDAGASIQKRALKGFKASSFSAVEDIDFNNANLRQRGRMLYMASPIAAAAINTNRTKIVGSGLRMKCSPNTDILGITPDTAKEWSRKTESEFRLWCKDPSNCDALGLNNFYELQSLAVKSWLMSGDVFVLLKRSEPSPLNPYSLRLQLVEADRVCTPSASGAAYCLTEGVTKDGNKIHDGVEVDGNGRVVAYHICSHYPGQFVNDKKPGEEFTRVVAKGEKTGIPNILQIMDAERPDQYRGVTILAPVIEMLLQSRRYTESELMAALIQSYFTAWIKTDGDTTDMPIFGDEDGTEFDVPDPEPIMAPGNIIHLKKGEDVSFGNPNMPTAGFEAFEKALIKQVGAALELPYDVLVKEFNSSYSAAKGALEEAWEVFKMRRSWFVNDFCQPVYEVWLSEAVARGRINAPGFFTDPLVRAAWCGARWDGPAQTHLDPVKEANANAMLVAHGWKTNEQITREYYGESWHDNAAALAEENKIFLDNFGAVPAAEGTVNSDEEDGDKNEE